jgi:hypothetical protein
MCREARPRTQRSELHPRQRCLRSLSSWPGLSGCTWRSPGRKMAFFASNPQVFATPGVDVLAVAIHGMKRRRRRTRRSLRAHREPSSARTGPPPRRAARASDEHRRERRGPPSTRRPPPCRAIRPRRVATSHESLRGRADRGKVSGRDVLPSLPTRRRCGFAGGRHDAPTPPNQSAPCSIHRIRRSRSSDLPTNGLHASRRFEDQSPGENMIG